MTLYKYIGKQPLSFVHNGIPSYLAEGMIIKTRLIDYVMKKYPHMVQEVIDTPVEISNPVPASLPESTPVPVIETTLVDVLNALEAPTQSETYDILYSVHSPEKVSAEISEISDEISDEILPKFDVSVLTSYEKVLELYKNELIDLCKQLGLETSGRKSTLVDRVCLKLKIFVE